MNRTIFLLALSLFTSIANSQTSVSIEQKVISGAVLLSEKKMPDYKKLLQILPGTWSVKADSASVSEKTLVFSHPHGTVMVAWLDYPYDPAEVGAAARLSWLWREADKALGHQSQLLISIIGTSDKVLEMNKLFTRVAGAVLETADAQAVYMNSQYLLLSRDFYLNAARNSLNNQSLPLYCWVYFGILGGDKTNSGYTNGLREFGFPELEVVDSPYSLQEVHALIYDVAASIVKNKIKPVQGAEITINESGKVKINISKGANLEQETAKIEF